MWTSSPALPQTTPVSARLSPYGALLREGVVIASCVCVCEEEGRESCYVGVFCAL